MATRASAAPEESITRAGAGHVPATASEVPHSPRHAVDVAAGNFHRLDVRAAGTEGLVGDHEEADDEQAERWPGDEPRAVDQVKDSCVPLELCLCRLTRYGIVRTFGCPGKGRRGKDLTDDLQAVLPGVLVARVVPDW